MPARWRAAPVLVAAAIAVAFAAVEPPTVDLAAADYRAWLFDAAGFTLWDNGWYSGHPVLSYSVLAPPLSALLGPALLGAVATVVAAALFEPLARGRSRWAAVWFATAVGASLLSGRIAFTAAVPFGVGAVLALTRGRPVMACVAALGCGLTSPLAGLFLALVAVAHATRAGLAAAAAALIPPAALALLFPDGSEAPFAFSAFWPIPLLALGLAALTRDRAVRAGALLYAALAVTAYVAGTPLGGSVVRLAALLGGTLVLLTATRPRAAAAVLFAGFAFVQVSPAVRDLSDAATDPAADAAFYRPLITFLEGAGGPPFRVEIPFTHSHREAAEVAPHAPLARGWLRPADREYNALFYDGTLTEASYGRWLRENAVRYVAVARAEPDYSARAELALIARRPPYLRPLWRSRDWRVYEVTGPASMGPVTRLGIDDVHVRLTAGRSAVVRVRWTRFWQVDGGCAERAADWTRVTAERTGELRMHVGPGSDGCD